jgi:flagellar FliL protein
MAKANVKQVSPAPAEASADAAGEAKPKKKGKLLVLIGVALVVLLAAAGGAWFFLHKKSGEDAEPEAKAQPAKPPVFVNLEPFTVNLQPDQGEQYLQVVTVLKVEDAKAGDSIKQYMPELRHRMLLLLSAKRASEISAVPGREKLAEELRNEANAIVAASAGGHGKGQAGGPKQHIEGPVQGVLFTSFIIQ